MLILGGAGFMGSNFTRLMAQHDSVELGVYDKLTYAGRLENLQGILDRIYFVRGDIRNEELLEHVFNEFEPDVVVNFAAETHVDRSINEPSPFIETNIVGVYTVLEVLRRKPALYVHVSTDEVYGDLAWTRDKADETWPLNPSSPYSASKASGELLVKSYGRTYGLRYKIVRPCNNYGPYQHPEKLIPRTIIRYLTGRPATIYGDGLQVRDWLYVEDFVEALKTVIDHGSTNEIYNICADSPATVKEIVENVIKILGGDPVKDIIYVEGRPGEDRRYAMKCDKIRELGWRPRISLDMGLRKTVEWYRANEWWWKPVVDRQYVLSDTPWRRRG